jgi:hypothetical protein
MNFVWAAITLGFLGSFHCVGMCGPIALALPLNHNSLFSKISGAILYNFGRMFTYALLGGLFGLLGQSFVIAGYQQALSITLGAAILIMVLLPSKVYSKFKITAFIYGYIGKLKQQLGLLFWQKKLFLFIFYWHIEWLIALRIGLLRSNWSNSNRKQLTRFTFYGNVWFRNITCHVCFGLIRKCNKCKFQK